MGDMRSDWAGRGRHESVTRLHTTYLPPFEVGEWEGRGGDRIQSKGPRAGRPFFSSFNTLDTIHGYITKAGLWLAGARELPTPYNVRC